MEDKLKGNRFSNGDFVKPRTPFIANKKTVKDTPKHEENPRTAFSKNIDTDDIFVNQQSQRQSTERQNREKIITNSATLSTGPRIVKIWEGKIMTDVQPSRNILKPRHPQTIGGCNGNNTNGNNTSQNSHFFDSREKSVTGEFLTCPEQPDTGAPSRQMTPMGCRNNSTNRIQTNPGANLASFRATPRRVNTYADTNANFISKNFGGTAPHLNHNQNHNCYYNNSLNSLRHHKNRKTSMGVDMVASNNEELNNKLVQASIGDPNF